jgi:hypothetical protein
LAVSPRKDDTTAANLTRASPRPSSPAYASAVSDFRIPGSNEEHRRSRLAAMRPQRAPLPELIEQTLHHLGGGVVQDDIGQRDPRLQDVDRFEIVPALGQWAERRNVQAATGPG